ncbi:MAG: hypothetical protein LCH26_08855, partial [Proteobacteria bacterium]|nr:hypothetical protein [Pseudomonadota bacterium]
DFNEAALPQLLTHLFLVHGDATLGKSPRGVFLSAYFQEQDYDKAANLLLQGKVKEETLAGLSLPLKLRATCLKDAEIDVEEALTRVMPMEEERALAILSFLRTHPLLYSQFWEAEKELSQTYIAWFAAHVTLGFDVSTLLLKYGELSKKRRCKLLDLPYPSQRIVRIKKWLREKDASL